MQHAAVLGCRFDALVLALAIQADLAELLARLQRCRDAGLIVAEDDEGYRWRFNHALVQQRFTAGVPAERWRYYHARALTALETLPESKARLDRLAYHAVESHDGEKTRLYSERAGDAALRIRALHEAQRYFAAALAAARDDTSRGRIQTKLTAAQERLRGPT